MSLFNAATPQQLHALARLGSPEMAPLVELLATTVARLQEQLVKADATHAIYRLQGEVAVLNDMLQSIKRAPEALAR